MICSLAGRQANTSQQHAGTHTHMQGSDPARGIYYSCEQQQNQLVKISQRSTRKECITRNNPPPPHQPVYPKETNVFMICAPVWGSAPVIRRRQGVHSCLCSLRVAAPPHPTVNRQQPESCLQPLGCATQCISVYIGREPRQNTVFMGFGRPNTQTTRHAAHTGVARFLVQSRAYPTKQSLLPAC